MGILPSIINQIDSKATIQTYQDNLLGKRTFQFDFDKNEFITDVMDHPIMTTNNHELLKQVVEKILHDRRYKNLIYPDYYGNEIGLILIQDDPYEVIECELRRCFTEALVYHPLIERVTDFSIRNEEDKVFCEFVVHGIDGTTVPVSVSEEWDDATIRL